MKIFSLIIKTSLILFFLSFFVYVTNENIKDDIQKEPIISTGKEYFEMEKKHPGIIDRMYSSIEQEKKQEKQIVDVSNKKYVIVYEPEMRFVYEGDNNLSEIDKFLIEDKTDEGEYQVWHSCGHFVRELSKNASKQNLSLGAAIFGDHPTFRGFQISHAMNYYYDESGDLWFIEPQLDRRYSFDYIKKSGQHRYVKLYPDGTQLPSRWKGNRAHDIKLY